MALALVAGAQGAHADPIPEAMRGRWAEPGSCGIAGKPIIEVRAAEIEVTGVPDGGVIRVEATPLPDDAVRLVFTAVTPDRSGGPKAGDSAVLQLVGDELRATEETVGGQRRTRNANALKRCPAPPAPPPAPVTAKGGPDAIRGVWGEDSACRKGTLAIDSNSLVLVGPSNASVAEIRSSELPDGRIRLLVSSILYASSPNFGLKPGDSLVVRRDGARLLIVEAVADGRPSTDFPRTPLQRCGSGPVGSPDLSAGQVPKALQGRWGQTAACTPDGLLVMIGPDSFTVIERKSPPIVLKVMAVEGSDGVTRLTVLSATPQENLSAGDIVVIARSGEQLKFVETIIKGVRRDGNREPPLVRCQ